MKAVIFGWKRDYLDTYLEDCKIIARNLVLDGYNIYTGGGEGFMNAANTGSYNVDKNKSFGITVKCLEKKEGHNKKIINENIIVTDTFSERKTKLIENYDIIIFFPGGMGTLDEFTEVMNLLKTNEIKMNTIILYGYKYWTSLIAWFEFNNVVFPMKFIDGIIDSVDEFNKLYKTKTKTNEDDDSVLTKVTTEEIKDYQPLFNKESIFNPFDDIDNLINIIFNNPDMMENLNDIDIKEINLKEDKEDKKNKKNNEDIMDLIEIIKNNELDDDIIIEIIYDYSDQEYTDDEKEKVIDPINFITDSDTDTVSDTDSDTE